MTTAPSIPRTCRCDLGNGEICTLDDEILQLAGWACLIEDHYSQVRGIYTLMDIEWAKDGITGKLSKPAQKRYNPSG